MADCDETENVELERLMKKLKLKNMEENYANTS